MSSALGATLANQRLATRALTQIPPPPYQAGGTTLFRGERKEERGKRKKGKEKEDYGDPSPAPRPAEGGAGGPNRSPRARHRKQKRQKNKQTNPLGPGGRGRGKGGVGSSVGSPSHRKVTTLTQESQTGAQFLFAQRLATIGQTKEARLGYPYSMGLLHLNFSLARGTYAVTTHADARSRYLLHAVWLLLLLVSVVAAGVEEGLIVLPDRAPRFSGPQGREADFTEILATREQTGGALGLFRQTIAPNSGPPTHIHQNEDEFFYVVSGEFSIKVGDRTGQRARKVRCLRSPGDGARVPKRRDAARRVAGGRDTRRVRENVRGTAGRGCCDKPRTYEKAQYGSRGTAHSVMTYITGTPT